MIVQAAEKEALKKEEYKKKKKQPYPDQGGGIIKKGRDPKEASWNQKAGEGKGQRSNQRKRSAEHTFFRDSDGDGEYVPRKKPRGEVYIVRCTIIIHFGKG